MPLGKRKRSLARTYRSVVGGGTMRRATGYSRYARRIMGKVQSKLNRGINRKVNKLYSMIETKEGCRKSSSNVNLPHNNITVVQANSGGVSMTSNIVSNQKQNDLSGNISFQVYQAAYHDLTGKTLKQSKSYEKVFIVKEADIDQLVYKLIQSLEQYVVSSQNISVTVFHHKGTREQYQTYDQFKAMYRRGETTPIVRFSIALDTLITPP